MAELPKNLRVNRYETLTVEPDSGPLVELGKNASTNDSKVAELAAKHQNKSIQLDRRVVYNEDPTPPAGTRSMPRSEKAPSDSFIDKLGAVTHGNKGRVVVVGLAVSMLAATGIAYNVTTPNEASAAAGSAEHRAVQNPDKLRALGLCANELIAQAEFNQRANVTSSIGFSAADYYDAAHFAQANEIPCFPDRTAVVVSNDEDMKAVTAGQISAFDAATACDQLAAATKGDTGSGANNAIVASIDAEIIADLSLNCSQL